MTLSKLDKQLLEIEEYMQKLKEEEKIKEFKEYEERLERLVKYDGPKRCQVSIYSDRPWWPFARH